MTERKPFAWTCYRGNGDLELSFDFPAGSDVSSARPLFLSSVSHTSADEPHITVRGAQRAKATSTGFDASPGFRDFMLGEMEHGEKAAQAPQETTAKPYGYAFYSLWSRKDTFSFTPPPAEAASNVRPVYEHPPAPADAKPVAWRYEWFQEIDIWEHAITEAPPSMWAGREDVRNVEPLFKHPPAPAAPVTTPEVEAARRKALGAIFAALAEYPWACDTCIVAPTGMTRAITYGVLRDLVGQPRKYPDRAIRGYDNDGPPGPHPLFGGKGEKAVPPPARLTVADLTAVIGAAAGGRPQFGNIITYGRIAMAVHKAIYGKDA